ncbi:MAG: hypothetical protein FJZ96_12805 [Chloroflexi bacterium]|nr:hypothetical protein [Chloroflexota bacterium]
MSGTPSRPEALPAFLGAFLDLAQEEVGKGVLEKVLGKSGAPSSALDPASLAALDSHRAAQIYIDMQQAIRNYFGRGARGSLLRIGRGLWQRKLEQSNFIQNAHYGILKILPLPYRCQKVLELVAKILHPGLEGTSVHLLDVDLLLVDRLGADSGSFPSDEPACFVTLGLIQAALAWATGMEMDVEEIACQSMGAQACEFKVALAGRNKAFGRKIPI